MGNRLIFLYLEVCDGLRKSFFLIGLVRAVKVSQEIASPLRPYPKPTQVVR